MIAVTLDQDSWNRVLAILAQAPWNVANPLIMAIGEQLRQSPVEGRPNGPLETGDGSRDSPRGRA